ncbi:MAG: hypothetical protein QGH27_04190 [SAR324 cluster bacterium]|jgi:hypothetical protein|nr:hypothetical protein [SAR324 cluster bacterium]|tara:strand:+ start:37 stop:1413 length:1377 start_codon:yes stop_codon:yes gene_type:complete
MATPTTQVIPPVQLPPGVVPTPQAGTSKDVLALAKKQAVTPVLPTGTAVTPVAQQVGVGETLATPGVATTAPTAAVPTATAQAAQAATAPTAVQVADKAQQAAAQYTATALGTAQQMTAAQGQVTAPMTAQTGQIVSDATVAGQLEGLQQQVQTAVAAGTDLPAWALGAQKLVEANMAKRGMGASSMYAEALAQGVMESAVPIAAQDAATYKEMIFQNLNNRQQSAVLNAQSYLQMDMANLTNNQQANLQNLQARQATLFSDQAASNAALQFNATSTNQVDQFYKNLSTSVATQNAQRTDAMKQFSNSEANKISAQNANNATAVSQANAQTEASINQFNSQLKDQREQFNVQNQQVIDQSNANWRRNINTANTAAINAANQTNAQNLLNISNFALSSLWQQWRDEATWTNEAAQNSLNRAHNMAVAALERQTAFDMADQQSRDGLFQLLGRFAAGVFS